MNTLKKLFSVGAIVIVGGVVIWNFPKEDPFCIQYDEKGVCIEELTKDEVCTDILDTFISQKENMCSENPVKEIPKLTYQDCLIWKSIQDYGCPAPNGKYDMSMLKIGPEYIYCDQVSQDTRRDELITKFQNSTINWVEKREAIGILQIEGTPLQLNGPFNDEELFNALSN